MLLVSVCVFYCQPLYNMQCPVTRDGRNTYLDRSSGACRVCPDDFVCTGAADQPPVVDAGRYPVGPTPGSLVSLPCRIRGACQPDVSTVLALGESFQCAAGRDPASLLCSQCLPGHFATALTPTCVQCPEHMGWAIAVVDVLVFGALMALIWRAVDPTVDLSATSEQLSLILFWFQVRWWTTTRTCSHVREGDEDRLHMRVLV